jgi:hypothetical protein
VGANWPCRAGFLRSLLGQDEIGATTRQTGLVWAEQLSILEGSSYFPLAVGARGHSLKEATGGPDPFTWCSRFLYDFL